LLLGAGRTLRACERIHEPTQHPGHNASQHSDSPAQYH
jgi:hypothetical protein